MFYGNVLSGHDGMNCSCFTFSSLSVIYFISFPYFICSLQLEGNPQRVISHCRYQLLGSNKLSLITVAALIVQKPSGPSEFASLSCSYFPCLCAKLWLHLETPQAGSLCLLIFHNCSPMRDRSGMLQSAV